jgi:hypothetical protein
MPIAWTFWSSRNTGGDCTHQVVGRQPVEVFVSQLSVRLGLSLPTRGQRLGRSTDASAFGMQGTRRVACASLPRARSPGSCHARPSRRRASTPRAVAGRCSVANERFAGVVAGGWYGGGHGQDGTRWRCPHDTSVAIPRANQPIRTSPRARNSNNTRHAHGAGSASLPPHHQPSPPPPPPRRYIRAARGAVCGRAIYVAASSLASRTVASRKQPSLGYRLAARSQVSAPRQRRRRGRERWLSICTYSYSFL